MRTKYKILLIISPLVFIFDQLTKLAILEWVPLGSRHSVIEGFFDIVHFRNTGAAFGILSGLPDSVRVPFFYIIAVVAVTMLVFLLKSLRENELIMPVAISLIFGGIVGNILDRVRLGSVVDFLSVHIGERAADFKLLGKSYNFILEWPAFNIADSAITVAIILFLYIVVFRKDIKL